MSNAAFDFVRQLGQDLAEGDFDLPPFPDTAMRVQRCVNDDDSSVQDLAGIVASEPALTARLMRMANSALIRRGPMEVTDINTAISRVGYRMVQNAAVSFAAREAFKCPPGAACADYLNALRQHSIKVAVYSFMIAGHCRFRGKADEAMLAGLLHAVGKFYLIMKAVDHPELFKDRDALDTLVGQWHTGVARAIVESWEFPESIAIGVDEQELVDRDRIALADVSDVLFVANKVATGGIESTAELGDLDALKRLRVSAEDLAALCAENAEEVQSTIDALSS